MKRLLQIFVLCIVTAGCYVTDEPVIESGAYAPIAGEFRCRSPFGQSQAERFKESKSGYWFFAKYSYEDSSGNVILFDKISSEFFLMQIQARGKPPAYLYADFLDDKQVVILAADVMSKAPYVENLASKNDVRTGPASDPLQIRLIGRKAGLLAFLKGHEKSMLRVAADCTRTP